MSSLNQSSYFTLRNWVILLLPSLIGVYLFMVPVANEKGLTIPVALMANQLKTWLGVWMPAVLMALIGISAFFTLIVKLFGEQRLSSDSFIKKLFAPSWSWVLVRVVGAICAAMVYWQQGVPELIGQATGQLVFNELLPVLLCVFIFAGMLLPLLLNFGLLEFVGTLMTKIMRPIFRLPGRSAVDCLASWIGDGSVGILLTSKQYEEGFYTAREAAVIGTTFSAVSITFCLVVLGQVKLEHMFLPFYLTICTAGLVAAIVLPYLPPLRNKPDTYIGGYDHMRAEGGEFSNFGVFKRALAHGLHRASIAPSAAKTVKDGVHNTLDMVFGVLPVIMAVGTFALVIAEHTPVFTWLGAPFVPLFDLLQIPFAEDAAKSVMVGFADMFVPSILISTVPSEMTRFVIAALSVTQLIYMSEVGALLLGSKIPVSFFDLLVLFILRTLITLPVIALMAHWLF